jgi:hypothetical protein
VLPPRWLAASFAPEHFAKESSADHVSLDRGHYRYSDAVNHALPDLAASKETFNERYSNTADESGQRLRRGFDE